MEEEAKENLSQLGLKKKSVLVQWLWMSHTAAMLVLESKNKEQVQTTHCH